MRDQTTTKTDKQLKDKHTRQLVRLNKEFTVSMCRKSTGRLRGKRWYTSVFRRWQRPRVRGLAATRKSPRQLTVARGQLPSFCVRLPFQMNFEKENEKKKKKKKKERRASMVKTGEKRSVDWALKWGHRSSRSGSFSFPRRMRAMHLSDVHYI